MTTYICDWCHGLDSLQKSGKVRQRALREADLLGRDEDLGEGSASLWKEVQDLVQRQAKASGRWLPGDRSRLRRAASVNLTAESAWQRVAGFWRTEPAVFVRVCRGCGLLRLVANADAKRSLSPLAFHRPCYEAACRTSEGRRWWHERLVLLRNGVPKAEVDRRIGAEVPTPRLRFRNPDQTTLTRYFGWAVRHLLGKESQVSIAVSAHYSRPLVTKAIGQILDLLPPTGARRPAAA